jgi:signal transduction histidine kinase
LPDSIEAAIYYLVAEAITNVAKYAQAIQASVAVEQSNGIRPSSSAPMAWAARSPTAAPGWVGLIDRVEALGGRLRVDSPPGRVIRLTAEIPCY